MKKKMFTLAAVVAFTVALTACGKAQTNNNSTPTAEPTVEAEVIATPATEPTTTPVSTETPAAEPTATSAPVVEPTMTPAAAPTEAPTAEPTIEAEATITPVVEQTTTPVAEPTVEPTKNPEAEVLDFSTMLKELHLLETYEEREAYVEKLDKSKYKVGEELNADLITKANGVYKDTIETYDITIDDYTVSAAPNSEMHYPFFAKQVLMQCAGIEDTYDYNYDSEDAGEVPTGEVRLMTVTNLATGETDPWGVKIYKAKAMFVTEEMPWGGTSYTKVVDPDSPVTVVCCTVEELVNEKNIGIYDECYEGNVTILSPIYPEEKYDENWNPTGEYIFYETREETVYVAAEDVKYDEWLDCYYCLDEYGWTMNLEQDENGAYYYILQNQYEVPVEERGYTVVTDDEYGTYGVYLVDKDGNVVLQSDEMLVEKMDPDITTWDTLKYYLDVYDPELWTDIESMYNYRGAYAILDLQAADYQHLSEKEFDSIIKRYLDVSDITLDEECLAIRTSIPEKWGEYYKGFCDKNGILSIRNDDDWEEIIATITIDRPDNWYFNTGGLCEVVVKDESICEDWPAHEAIYMVNSGKPGKTDEETRATAVEYLLRAAWDASEEDIKSLTVNGKPVFYVETSNWGDARYFSIIQDIGQPFLIEITLESYDVKTEESKLIEQFLLDDNYSVTP